MLLRTFTLLTFLVTLTAPLFGQIAGPAEKDTFMFFNHATPMPGMEPALFRDRAIQKVQSALGLSEVQSNALKTLLTMHEQTTQQILQSAQESERKLQELAGQTNPNPMDVGTAFLASRGVQTQLQAAAGKFRTDFKAMLSSDQRAALDKLAAAAEHIGGLTELGILDGGPVRAFAMPFGGMATPATGAIRIERRISRDR